MNFKNILKKFRKYARITCLLALLVIAATAFCVVQLEKTYMGRDVIKDNPFTRLVFDNSPHVQLLEFSGTIFSSANWLKAMNDYTKHKNCRALVIRLISGGGGVTASEELALGLIKFKRERGIPVIIYATSVVASGAYYFACSADAIVSSQSCILGSIGVIMGHADLSEFYENESRNEGIKVNNYEGIKITYFKTGLYKDIGASHRPPTDSEVAIFQKILDEANEYFLDHVMDSRRHKFFEVADDVDVHRDILAQAKLYMPREAKKIGLIDRIGTLEEAILLAKSLSGLLQNAQVRTGNHEYDGFHVKYIQNMEYTPNVTTRVQAILLGWEL